MGDKFKDRGLKVEVNIQTDREKITQTDASSGGKYSDR